MLGSIAPRRIDLNTPDMARLDLTRLGGRGRSPSRALCDSPIATRSSS
ncbi:MAG: hypothetical protein J7551_04940 [Chloroflexi bacterium]|nr:hypothetical protein [Chloroflexota bacterium]